MTAASSFIIAFKTDLTQHITFIFNFAHELIQIFFLTVFLTKLNKTYHNHSILQDSNYVLQAIKISQPQDFAKRPLV